MSKWLAVFLLLLLPLQITWAAANAYCHHESDVASEHFGHHDHEHKAVDTKDPVKTDGGDSGCTACHWCSFVSTPTATLPSVFETGILNVAYLPTLPPPPIERIERPQWLGFA